MFKQLKLRNQIQCGMVMPGQSRAQILDYGRRMEAAGFESIWVGDHVSFYIPVMESLTTLAFLAAATERVKLGTSVYLLPLRQPGIAAKITSTLDVLCEGRLLFGVGVGGEFPPEFEVCGIPRDERGPRTDEGIAILRKLWRDNPASHEGRFTRFGKVSLDPKPVQPGGPPILIGGRREPSFRRAGEHGDGYISHMCSARQFHENLSLVDQHAKHFGRGQVDFDTSAFLFTFVDDSYDRALDRAAAMLQKIYNRPFRDAARKYCLLGRPEDMLRQMQDFVDAGARRFIFSVPEDPEGFIALYQQQIAPALGKLQL